MTCTKMKWGFVASIGLNIALLGCAGYLLFDQLRPEQTEEARPSVPTGEPDIQTRKILPPSPVTPFRWSQVESTDYATYVANLRAIECPEKAIRSLVVDELAESFAQERRELQARSVSRSPDAPAAPGQLQQELQELERDQQKFLSAVLGPQTPQTAANAQSSANRGPGPQLASNAAATLPMPDGQRARSTEPAVSGDTPAQQVPAADQATIGPSSQLSELPPGDTPPSRPARRDLFTPEQQRYRALWGWSSFYNEPAPAP